MCICSLLPTNLMSHSVVVSTTSIVSTTTLNTSV
uniref:Uncharacterized protein n=1 Tax=Arundo donax TaxID=35708 RepID=A0A0A8ZWR7_ARUDO